MTNTQPSKEKGRRIAFIPWRAIPHFGAVVPKKFHVPLIPDLPTTATVVGVWSDYARQAFAMVWEDESFTPCAPGACLEELEVQWRAIQIDDFVDGLEPKLKEFTQKGGGDGK